MTHPHWSELEGFETENGIEAWQHGRTGEVLAIETYGRRSYQLVTLPENYYEDNNPLEHLAKGIRLTSARQHAHDYMRKGKL